MADAMCAGIGGRDCALTGIRATNWARHRPEEPRSFIPYTATPQATAHPPTSRAMSQASCGGGLARPTMADELAHTAHGLSLPATADFAAEQGTPTQGRPHTHTTHILRSMAAPTTVSPSSQPYHTAPNHPS
ncbi:Hypothetical predicted protein [Pelobates cultripes]|uniref:Uncharacterized protein n=1 Tax=Pelobates cultripes TaxID=61616 RepID=A0AAD1RMM7_PELCU|nr:Hypothetical predicted protein [Pelobates cultripes]